MRMCLRIAVCVVATCVAGGCSKDVPVDEVSTDGRTLPEIADIEFGPDDWPWWRGAGRNGIAAGDSYPTEWSAEKNVVWKTKVPGRGHASPTVVGDNIFVATADKQRGLQTVLCYNRQSGDLRWRKDVHEGGLGKVGHSDNTFASSTIGCDGKRVFAVFRNDGKIKVTALDIAGEQLWQKTLGGHQTSFGFGSSPVIYKQLVIITADSSGGGFIAALNRKTGDTWWLKKRHNANDYSSSIVANVAGKDQLLLAGGQIVTAYDPMTGDEYWSTQAYDGTTCSSMVWQDDLVFANSGFGGKQTVAVKADGSKEVVWKKGQLDFYVPSLLLYDGHIYAVTNGGIGYCIEAATGNVAWKTRMNGNYYASPILAGGNVYMCNRSGTTTVFKASPKRFELVSRNKLGSAMDASPVACGGRLYLRVADNSGGGRQEWLYCIGR